MPISMRLMRRGTTHNPVYRISIGDSRKAPTAKFMEHIGTYNPRPDKMGHKQLRLNVARAKYWIAMGCQPSSMVARLLSRFHLLPTPPARIPIPSGALLHKVLAGEDVRAEIRAMKVKTTLPSDPVDEEAEEDEAEELEKLSEEQRAERKASKAAHELIERRVASRLTGVRRRAALVATRSALPLSDEHVDPNAGKSPEQLRAEAKERLREERDLREEEAEGMASWDPEMELSNPFDPLSTVRLQQRIKPRKLSASLRFFKEPSLERIQQLQRQAPWKLQLFPFQPQPSLATEAAWEQARRFHYRVLQYPLPALGRSHRAELKNALARDRHRLEREQDAREGRPRGLVLEARDRDEDLDALSFAQYVRRAAGLEESLAADADRIDEAEGEDLLHARGVERPRWPPLETEEPEGDSEAAAEGAEEDESSSPLTRRRREREADARALLEKEEQWAREDEEDDALADEVEQIDAEKEAEGMRELARLKEKIQDKIGKAGKGSKQAE